MNILLINDHYPPEGGGAAQVVKNYADAFCRAGHSVLVFTTHDGALVKKEIQNGVTVAFLPIRYPLCLRSYLSLWNPKTARHLNAALQDFHPDVAFAHNIHSYFSYRTLALLKNRGIKTFLTLHDVMTVAYAKAWPRTKQCDTPWRVTMLDNLRKARKQYNPLRGLCIRHYLSFPEKIITVSDALKSLLAENGIHTDLTIHNGIALDDNFSHDDNGLLAQHGLLEKRFILFGGRLTSAKGGEQLIEAAAPALKAAQDARLVIVGDGPERPLLAAQAARLGLADKIIFLGHTAEDDMHRLYGAAYCVAVPSISFDSFPTMNLEAMLHKKPVIATCFGGSKEAVTDGVTGFIVNPYDVEALRSKIQALFGDPALAQKMGEAGFLRAREKFNIQSQIQKLLALV